MQDFEQLKNLSVNVTGKIAIMRYGKIFRGNKVMLRLVFGSVFRCVMKIWNDEIFSLMMQMSSRPMKTRLVPVPSLVLNPIWRTLQPS